MTDQDILNLARQHLSHTRYFDGARGFEGNGPAMVRFARAVLADALPFDLRAHLQRQAEFSARTFGPGDRTAGVCDHIRKELIEVQADAAAGVPTIGEWADVIILGFDGAWRSGATPAQIIDAIVAKQTKNEGRKWPDWRTADPTKAIEHDRTGEQHGQHHRIAGDVCKPDGLRFDAFGQPRTRYVRVSLNGSHCVMEPSEGDCYVEEARNGGDPDWDRYVVTDVYLSRREFEDLPDHDGF